MPPLDNDLTEDVIKTIGDEFNESEVDENEEVPDDDDGPDQPDDDDDDHEEVDGDDRETDEEDNEFKLNTRPDKKGNLVDPKTGKIIAPAGSARRFYEKAIKTGHQLQQAQTEISRQRILMNKAAQAMQSMKSELEARDKQDNLPKQMGLEPAEYAEALQVFSKFKNSATAIDALKYMLTRAVQRGIDIKPLGIPGATMDMSVFSNDIQRQLETTLKPINDRLQERDQQTAERQKLIEERETFYLNTQVPEQYVAVLDRMRVMPNFMHLGYQGAWLMLQNYLLRQGNAAQRGSPGQESRGRPSGRARPGFQDQGNQIDDSPVDVDTDFGQLVKDVIKDYTIDGVR